MKLIVSLLTVACYFLPLSAAEPPSAPILRVEAGMHTARINRIATDAAGRVALTCSHDKTARLWALGAPASLPALLPFSGKDAGAPRLLRTFRIPFDERGEDQLYACALSPDGAVAALGGWAGYEWGKSNSIYLFDTTSGRLLRRLVGLSSMITDLAFSASGRYVAAVLGAGGLRVYDAATGTELGRDTDYGDDSYGVDWHGDEALVSTCEDGKVRLYHIAPAESPMLVQDTQIIRPKFEDKVTDAPAVTPKADLAGWEVVRYQDRDYVSSSSIYRFYGFAEHKVEGSAVWFISKKLVMKGTIGSQDLMINNVKFVMSYPISKVNGESLFSRLDHCKLIDPILRPDLIGYEPFETVIIDPAHGGSDFGARGIFGNEKDYTLRLAILMKADLERRGLKVILTREDDSTVSDTERIHKANQIPKSIFIGVGFNEGAASRTGIETMTLAPREDKDDLAITGNNHDTANIALATAVHAAVIHHFKFVDLGAKRARTEVLKGLERPGIYLKAGFLTNPQDGRLIAAENFRSELAHTIGDAIFNYRMALARQSPGRSQPAVASNSRTTLLSPVAKASVKGGKSPYSARFSPDGTKIAVGFTDTTAVTVLDGTDLSLLFTPDTSGVGNGDLSKVAWSADNNTLAAGGLWQDGTGAFPIRLWSQSGRGSHHDAPVTQSTVMDIHPLPGGGFLWGAGDPAWGVITDSRGQVFQSMIIGIPPIARWEHTFGRFLVADDARTASFSWDVQLSAEATFSVADRSFRQSTNARGAPPRLKGLVITSWCSAGNDLEVRNAMRAGCVKADLGAPTGFTSPQLGTRPLNLKRHEISRSLAIAPDASFFLLGTEWRLLCFAKDGTERWNVSARGAVWAVNLSADGALALAAYGDGTIRWHRASDGKELLSFFPHADRKRWVLWTPEGYFDCSPGGEDIIGWQVNREKDQAADFFPAARFRAIYYRPDVISRVLKTRSVSEALRQANAALGKPAANPESIAEVIAQLSPPVVELVTGGMLGTVPLASNADHVNVRYRVRNTGREHATRVDIRLNGRPMDVAAPLPANGAEAEVSVPLPDGLQGELSIIASHKLSSSEAAILRVKREGGRPANVRKPDLYVVAVGVAHLLMSEGVDTNSDGVISDAEIAAKYSKSAIFFDDLHNAASDARRIGELFQEQQGGLFGRVIPRVLLDKEATTAAIREALRAVAREAKAGDVVLFFFSGHGYTDEKTEFFLVTHDTMAEKPVATALTGRELTQLLGKIRGSVLLSLDTCHSGAALGKLKDQKVITGPEDLTGLINTLSSAEQGVVVLSSASETEESFESKTQGYFTQAVIEGVKGRAGKDGNVSCQTLQDFITQRLPELVGQNTTIQIEGKTQTPFCIMPKGVPDFPLALTSTQPTR